MSRAAAISSGIFALLLLLVIATSGHRVSVGIHDLELPQLASDQVTGIDVEGEFQVRLLRDSGSWTVQSLEDPSHSFPVEEAALRSALAAVSGLEAGTFVTGRSENHAELEIDEEKGTTIRVTGGAGQELALVLGRQAKQGGVLLRLPGAEEVFIGPAELSSALRLPLEAWRRQGLVDLEPGDIERLSFSLPGRAPFALVGSVGEDGKVAEASWQLDESVPRPEGFALDANVSRERLRWFSGLRASEFVDDDLGEEKTGLGAQALRVSAFPVASGEAAPKSAVEILLGKEDESGQVYAQLVGDPQIYLVPGWSIDRIASGLDGLRDLSLINVDIATVQEFSIQHAGGTTQLKRGGESNSWEFVDSGELPADYRFSPTEVDAQLRRLNSARALRFAGTREQHAASLVDRVELRLTLSDGGQQSVRIGAQVPGEEASNGVYAEGSDGYVYVVPASLRSRYDAPLELFRERPPPTPPPGQMGGMGGMGGQGLDSLPPEVRRQIEEAMRQQGGPQR